MRYFLDLSKAFDTVNHNILLDILCSIGFRGHFNLLLQSYLHNRSFRIKQNTIYFSYNNIMRGVPQGSIISPILYSLYVYDFSTIHPNAVFPNLCSLAPHLDIENVFTPP